jgi:hypothetical protein
MCLHSAYEVGGVVYSSDLSRPAQRLTVGAGPPESDPIPAGWTASTEPKGASHG